MTSGKSFLAIKDVTDDSLLELAGIPHESLTESVERDMNDSVTVEPVMATDEGLTWGNIVNFPTEAVTGPSQGIVVRRVFSIL